MANTHFATDGRLDVSLGLTHTSAKHALGSRVNGNNESEWMYVYASAALTAYVTVGVEASGTASPLTAAIARTGATIGIAQNAFSAADYGWVATKGRSLRVATTAAVAIGVRLYTAASSAGRVDDAAASTEVQLGGLYLIATASGTSASSAACVAGNLVVIDAAFII